MKRIDIYNLIFFSVISVAPTILSFFGHFEGNKQRLFLLFMLIIYFFIQNFTFQKIKIIYKQMLKDKLCLFLAFTTFISFIHFLFQDKSSSINYVDFFAPFCLVIYSFFVNKKNSIYDLKKIFYFLLSIWVVTGFFELIANLLFDNNFCLPKCIYYENRPNSLLYIQKLLNIDSGIAIESIGLNTQQFSLVLGILFLTFLDILKKEFSINIFIFLLFIIFLEIFSMSYTVLLAQTISALFLFGIHNIKLFFKLILFLSSFFLAFLFGYYLNFPFFSYSEYYLFELLIRPILFLFNQNWFEIIFGIIDSDDVYPAENRIFVLLYRFGLIWFCVMVYILFHASKKMLNKDYNFRNVDRSIFIFLLIASVHNHLWHTISGYVLLSFILIYFYEILKNKNV